MDNLNLLAQGHVMRAAGIGVVVRDENGEDRMLLGRRSMHLSDGGLWSVPAGRIEDGEELAEGVVREFEEETGINAGDIGLGAPLAVSSVWNQQVIFSTCVARAERMAEPSPGEDYAWENDEFTWARVKDIPYMADVHPGLLASLPMMQSVLKEKHQFETDADGKLWMVGSHFTSRDFEGRPQAYHEIAQEADQAHGSSFGTGLYVAPGRLRDDYLGRYGKPHTELSGVFEWKLRVAVPADLEGVVHWKEPVPAPILARVMAAHPGFSMDGEKAPLMCHLTTSLGTHVYVTTGQGSAVGGTKALLAAGVKLIVDDFCLVVLDPATDVDWTRSHREVLKEPANPAAVAGWWAEGVDKVMEAARTAAREANRFHEVTQEVWGTTVAGVQAMDDATREEVWRKSVPARYGALCRKLEAACADSIDDLRRLPNLDLERLADRPSRAIPISRELQDLTRHSRNSEVRTLASALRVRLETFDHESTLCLAGCEEIVAFVGKVEKRADTALAAARAFVGRDGFADWYAEQAKLAGLRPAPAEVVAEGFRSQTTRRQQVLAQVLLLEEGLLHRRPEAVARPKTQDAVLA